MTPEELENTAIKLWSENKIEEARNFHWRARELAPNIDWIRYNDCWFIRPNFKVDNTFLEQSTVKNSTYKDSKISLLVVSYSRPEGAMRIASTARVTAKRPELVEILICTDKSDPLLDRYKVLPELNVHIIDQHRTSDKWNYLYNISTGEIIFMVCDDVIFESWGWDEVLRNVWPDDGVAVMYSDASNGKEFLEFPILSKKMVNTLGYCAYPKLDHWGLDVWWSVIGSELNKLYYLGPVLKHRHQHYEISDVHKRNFRTPLNIIKDYSDVIKTEASKLV
jgi:hypothetical protein